MPLQPTLKQVYTDVQLAEIDNYITNKINGQITVQKLATASEVTIDSKNYGVVITALDQTLTVNNPSGLWVEMQPFMFRITSDGGAQDIDWESKFNAVNTTLPSTVGAAETVYIGGVYNAVADTFDVLGVN